jgi:FkbM family methyltransferase
MKFPSHDRHRNKRALLKSLARKVNRALKSATGYQLARPQHDYARLFLLLAKLRGDEMDPRDELAESFARFILPQLSSSRSQLFQDLWVLFELLQKRGGFFVEIGASDGLSLSNTWLLETAYSWRGILAEANPALHASLAANRQAAVDSRCVYSKSGEQLEFRITDEPHLSTLAEFAGSDHNAPARSRYRRVTVPTVSLKDLLDAHQAPNTIDYLSIDTEGSEWEILRAYDFSRRIHCISVEHGFSERRERIRKHLESRGFVNRIPDASAWDDWYLHEDVLR